MLGYCKCFFALGPLLALAASIATALGEADPQKIYRKAIPSVMTLEVENRAGENFIGTAVLILADDTAVTAWHVVSDARFVWATFADGTRVKVVGCIDSDGKKDLALVKLERGLPGRRAVLNRVLQSVATRTYAIGAPKGFGFSISDGLVSQIRQVDGFPQYQVSCPISPGNSGGPLLDQRARVIGIVSWSKSDAQNLSFAIPSGEIERLNCGRKATEWEKIPPTVQPRLALHSVDYIQPATIEGEFILSHRFKDFTRRLEQSAGKKITVVVREDGQETDFTFTVPRQLSR